MRLIIGFIFCCVPALVFAQNLPVEVRKDMHEAALAKHLVAKNYVKSLREIAKLRALGVKLEPGIDFFEGEASCKTKRYITCQSALTKYIQRTGRKGRYYQRSLPMLALAREKAVGLRARQRDKAVALRARRQAAKQKAKQQARRQVKEKAQKEARLSRIRVREQNILAYTNWTKSILHTSLPRSPGSTSHYLSYSRDGRRLVYGTSRGFKIWDFTRSRSIVLEKLNGFILGAHFGPHGDRLVVCTIRKLLIRSIKTGQFKTVASFDSTVNSFLGCAFSPDGKSVIAQVRNRYGSIYQPNYKQYLKIYKLDRWSRNITFPGISGRNALAGIEYSPDGQSLATLDKSGRFRLWDVKTQKVRVTFELRNGRDLSFTRDGQKLMVGSQYAVRLLSLKSGTHKKFTSTKEWIFSSNVSPDGSIIATVSHSAIEFRNIRSGKKLATLRVGRTGMVPRIRYSPNGRFLAATSGSGPIHIWDVKKMLSRPFAGFKKTSGRPDKTKTVTGHSGGTTSNQ